MDYKSYNIQQETIDDITDYYEGDVKLYIHEHAAHPNWDEGLTWYMYTDHFTEEETIQMIESGTDMLEALDRAEEAGSVEYKVNQAKQDMKQLGIDQHSTPPEIWEFLEKYITKPESQDHLRDCVKKTDDWVIEFGNYLIDDAHDALKRPNFYATEVQVRDMVLNEFVFGNERLSEHQRIILIKMIDEADLLSDQDDGLRMKRDIQRAEYYLSAFKNGVATEESYFGLPDLAKAAVLKALEPTATERTVVAPDNGTAIAGHHGVAIAGLNGVAAAGAGGYIMIEARKGMRGRKRWISLVDEEEGLEPNVKYSVTRSGEFFPV